MRSFSSTKTSDIDKSEAAAGNPTAADFIIVVNFPLPFRPVFLLEQNAG